MISDFYIFSPTNNKQSIHRKRSKKNVKTINILPNRKRSSISPTIETSKKPINQNFPITSSIIPPNSNTIPIIGIAEVEESKNQQDRLGHLEEWLLLDTSVGVGYSTDIFRRQWPSRTRNRPLGSSNGDRRCVRTCVCVCVSVATLMCLPSPVKVIDGVSYWRMWLFSEVDAVVGVAWFFFFLRIWYLNQHLFGMNQDFWMDFA